MARWWGFDPDAVARWAFVDFTDRQEFMRLQIAIEAPPGKDGIAPWERPWKPNE